MLATGKKSVVLAILDGWGFSDRTTGNPLKQANLPTLTAIDAQYPMVLLQASGPAVGMSWGETGNSEVGHLALGAGRIVEQYHFRINHSIDDGSFFANPALLSAMEQAKARGSTLHLVGLLTSNTVHSALGHLVALLKMARQRAVPNTRLHLFLDGRDSGLQEAPALLAHLNEAIQSSGLGAITTLIGRDYAMDRDNNWERTQMAYELIANGSGVAALDYLAAVAQHYQAGSTDSNMPALLVDTTYTGLAANDAIICFNFREDSMRQLFRAFTISEFTMFPRVLPASLQCVSMTQYLEAQAQPVAFPPPHIPNGLAEYLSAQGKTQLHIAETDKYAHVTFFFNGLKNRAGAGETDIFIDSVKAAAAHPEMSAAKLAATVCAELERGSYDFVLLNLANADLLAHTGNFNTVVKGAEAVDTALGQLLAKVLAKDGTMLITADHGNAESLFNYAGGEVETKHNDSPVFCYLVSNAYRLTKTAAQSLAEKSNVSGILSDVAPTILALLGLSQPPEMTGQSLLPVLLKK